MKSFEGLREKYRTFYYHGYSMEEDADFIRVTYHFEIENLSEFTPTWKFPKGRFKDGHGDGGILQTENSGSRIFDDKVLKKLVFSLGMVELISYWKIACPPNVIVRAGALTDAQVNWWKKLYYYGLGEFFYTNGISVSVEEFMNISSEGEEIAGESDTVENDDRFLVPVGGGKDSAVTLELLKQAGKDICAYIINPRGATINSVKAAGLADDKMLTTARTLDRRMIELNSQGFLNGHTPYSAIVAFSSTITAYLYGIRYIALSNEASANESTVKGSFVNHQYSKSFEFEKDFHDYETEYIKSGTYYFSMLRPLSEFQIARYFAKCTDYHDIFRSCNAGSKEDKWCGHCPKCMFVYLILAPFLGHDRVTEIFGADMVNDESMIPVLDQLTGVVDEKPFECVGSRDEVKLACCMEITRYRQNGQKLPVLYEHYVASGQYNDVTEQQKKYFSEFEEENLLDESLGEFVRANCCMPE